MVTRIKPQNVIYHPENILYNSGAVAFSGCPADDVSQAAAIEYCRQNKFTKDDVRIVKVSKDGQTFINVIVN